MKRLCRNEDTSALEVGRPFGGARVIIGASLSGANIMDIRPASPADVPSIRQIVVNAYSRYVERIGKPPGPMLDDYNAHVRNHTAWVAEADGIVMGLVVLLPKEDHLVLDNVAVDPACHGRGIGRALLAFADHEAIRRGYDELRLYTHEKMTENLVMYPALGWKEIGRGEQSGYKRVFFRKYVDRDVPLPGLRST